MPSDIENDTLLAALTGAEEANGHRFACQVCSALEQMPTDHPVRAAVIRAIGGTIGEQKLSVILTGNGYKVGRRAIARHRAEGHQIS